MFAIGVPKTQYRRTHDVLSHSRSKPIDYFDEKQDDGFFMFYFPEMDEDTFSHIVKVLKANGVTAIGADSQLTEKKIMKLADLYKSLNDKPLHEIETTGGQVEKFKVDVEGEMVDVTLDKGHATGMQDVTISWGDESHNVNFEDMDPEEVEDHDNEGKDMVFRAISKDKNWEFALDVSVQADYDISGIVQDIDWRSLEIEKVEGTMSDDDVDRAFTVDAPDRPLQEQFQRLAGIKPLYEQGFDDRLKSMMGDDDFEKATNPELAKLINNAIMSIDPNMSYVDFAKGVAQVLIDEYGVQNYEPFISELKKELDSTLG